MKYSFIFSYNENINYEEVFNSFKSFYYLDRRDYELIFLAGEKEEPHFALLNEGAELNAVTLIFDDKSTEDERIETAIKRTQGKNLIITRNSYSSFNIENYIEILNHHANEKHVVVSTRKDKDNIVYEYYNSVKKFMTKFFLGFQTFDGEADIILLDNIALQTLKTTRGRSPLLTKFNNWHGLNISYVKIEKQNKIKTTRKPRAVDIVGLIMSLVILAGLITTEIVLSYFKLISVLASILVIACILGAFFFSIYFLFRMLFFMRHGYLTGIANAQIKKEI